MDQEAENGFPELEIDDIQPTEDQETRAVMAVSAAASPQGDGLVDGVIEILADVVEPFAEGVVEITADVISGLFDS